MVTVPIVCTIGSSGADGIPLSPSTAPAAAQGGLPADTDVDDAIAVLVADGIAPTQAHVTTLDAAWTTYQAAIAAYSAAGVSGNMVLSIDTAVVTTKRKARAGIATFMQALNSGIGSLPD